MADIMTPALGESVTEATVARWTKKAGDAVRKDEILVELETDKVSLEVASPSDGTLTVLILFTAPSMAAACLPGSWPRSPTWPCRSRHTGSTWAT